MGPDLRQLRYYLALAEQRSFTRAAARLHLTQQALSLAIKQLEQRVNVDLIVRRVGSLELTAAGETLLEHARQTVAAADRLEAAMRVHRDGHAGRLRVGLVMDGAGPLTAPILAAFRDARPQAELTVRLLDPSQGHAPLLDGTVDVAIVHGPQIPDERIETRQLFLEPRVVAVAAHSPLADAPELAIADLLGRRVGARHPAMPVSWEGFFTLVADRNGEEPERVGPPAETFDEVLWNIGLRDLVLTLPGHFAHSYAAERFGISYVPLANAAPVAFLLAVPRAAATPLADAFCEIAQQVTGELLALVPGARLAPRPIATA